ncbi:hypothetical protein ES708_15240 [subsurface metagenome]
MKEKIKAHLFVALVYYIYWFRREFSAYSRLNWERKIAILPIATMCWILYPIFALYWYMGQAYTKLMTKEVSSEREN